MAELLPDTLCIRMLRITLHAFKEEMAGKARALKASLLSTLAAQVQERNTWIASHFDAMMSKIMLEPDNAEELAELQAYTKSIANEVDEMLSEQNKVRASMVVLERLGHDLQASEVDTFWRAVGQPKELVKAQAFVVQRQEDERLRFMQEVRDSVQDLNAELKSVDSDLQKLMVYTDIDLSEEYAGTVSVLEMRLKEAAQRAVLINSREALFEMEASDFSDIPNLVRTFEPFASLWTTMAQV